MRRLFIFYRTTKLNYEKLQKSIYFSRCYALAVVKHSLRHNVLWLCVRWGFPALKPIDSTKFNLSTNDYR